jgi:hypothetical protein
MMAVILIVAHVEHALAARRAVMDASSACRHDKMKQYSRVGLERKNALGIRANNHCRCT